MNQVQLLLLTAKLAHYIVVKRSEHGSADMCNLNELALAALGFADDSPQVPLEDIVTYVSNQVKNIREDIVEEPIDHLQRRISHEIVSFLDSKKDYDSFIQDIPCIGCSVVWKTIAHEMAAERWGIKRSDPRYIKSTKEIR